MLDISITLVVIAHVVVSLLLILVILMQRPKQEGLGAAFGAGMTDAAFGAKTTDVLQKGTVYLGTLFFIFSLVLAILMGKRNSIEGKNYASDGGSVANAPVESNEGGSSLLENSGEGIIDTPADATGTPVDATGTPSDATGTPAEGAETPAEGTGIPAEGTETPAEAIEIPAEGTETPAEETGTPAEGAETPAEATETPEGGVPVGE